LPSLSKTSQTNTVLKNEKGEKYISLYSGELTARVVTQSMAKVKKAFPGLPIDFFTVLSERVAANGFTDERIQDAVNHVVDTCKYPTPTVADFMSFDKKRRIYTYAEMCNKVHEAGGLASVWDSYEMMEIKSTKFWYSKADNLTQRFL
jgi:hypothetical protein